MLAHHRPPPLLGQRLPGAAAACARRPAAARTRPRPRTVAASQYVPSDSFGGRSPERVAADSMRSLFTFAAAKIVLAQLEGSGRGGLAAYDSDLFNALSSALTTFTAATSPTAPPPPPGLTRADVWLSDLARLHRGAALRIMEVRASYAATDFEWDSTARLSGEGLRQANTAIMRALASESLSAGVGSAPTGGENEVS